MSCNCSLASRDLTLKIVLLRALALFISVFVFMLKSLI